MQRKSLTEVRDLVAASLPSAYEPLLLTFYGHGAHAEGGDIIIIGDDYGTKLHLVADGTIVSIDPDGKLPRRFVNSSVGHLSQFVQVVSRTDRSDEAHEREMWHRLAGIDPTAFAEPENWWAVILEQVQLEAGW